MAILFEQKYAWGSVFLFSSVLNVLMLAPSIYMMQVYDRVLTSRNLVTLTMLALLALAIYAATSALDWARARILVRIGIRFDHALGARMLECSHRLGLEQNGGAGGRLLSDLSNLRMFLTGSAVIAVLDAPWVPIFFFVTMLLHPLLALTMLAGAIVMVVLTLATERAVQGPLAVAGERASEAMRFAGTNMRNAEVIESMGMFQAMRERWQSRQDEHLHAQARASDRAGWTSALSRFVRTTNQSATMTVGAYLTIQGDISPAVIIAASLLTSRMLLPIEQITSSWSYWGSARDSWDRIDEALSLPERTYSSVALPAPKGEIGLEGVYGGPPHVDTPFIQNVTLKVPAGSSVAIVGSSASGKSTLLRLIAGVWAPRLGAVRLDGAEMRHWPRAQLGPFIGYLPQDVELVEGSIAENIARHGTVESDKVIAAATAAGVHEMILHMSDGYNTQVGANGSYLSGGQRQRIALARALYGNPSLLILDEPNANLDEAGEIALDMALRQAKQKGQTVLIVSHRPTAIRNCDLILVMQAGQVVMYGPREQVMAAMAKAAGVTAMTMGGPAGAAASTNAPAVGQSAPPAIAKTENAPAPS